MSKKRKVLPEPYGP